MIILIRQLILTRLVNIGIAGDRDTVWSAILLQNCYQYLWYTFSKQNQNTSPFRCNESFRDWQVTKFTIHNSHTKSGDWQLPRPIRCIHRSAVEHCRPIQWVFSLASHVFTRPSMHFHRVTLCYHGVCCRRVSLCLSVCHKPVLNRNDGMNQAGFWHGDFLAPILHCVIA